MGKSIAIAAGLVVCAAAVVVMAAGVEMTAEMHAAMEMEHYAQLWTAASSEHVAVASNGAQTWRCCRACAKNTVPILHEAFEQDKDDMPAMKGAPPAKPGKFIEMSSAAGSAAAEAVEAYGRGRGRGRKDTAKTAREKTEFQIMMRRKAIAQADALAGRRVDSTAYSCCNMCPDLMYPFPGTWNRPSAYSYAPPPRFRFAKKPTTQGALVETASLARAATGAESTAESEEASESSADSASDRYVPTNPHNLPAYYYWESTQKAGPARSFAARDGKFDPPLRPGAAPIWHPPPPPHDDIYRMSRSPNLHDGADLKTPPFLPPCCDFCMSTYFPHIINDEWQLPKKVPYSVGPFSKAFVQVDEHIGDAQRERVMTKAATKAKVKKEKGVNQSAISSAEAAAKLLPSAKSDPKNCCHKCVRKDIEDTDWRVYALPPPPKTKKPPHHPPVRR